MGDLTEEQIQIALSRLEHGLTKYLWLQRQVKLCDVSANEEFQRCFSGFYRMRRNSEWRMGFFALLESSKLNGIGFPEALREIHHRCGMVEASFASKLVATLDPSKPVIDKFVLEYFAMRLPTTGLRARHYFRFARHPPKSSNGVITPEFSRGIIPANHGACFRYKARAV